MRLNKYLANSGLGSRRHIDRAITNGEVLVNNKVASLGQILQAGDQVKYQGQTLNYQENEKQDHLYIAFNKPPGVVCTCAPDEPNNIIDYLLNHPKQALSNKLLEKIQTHKIYPIGRLDKESRGLILLTNDGDLTQQLTHPKYEHEKEYLVTCKEELSKKFLNDFSSGVEITPEDDDQPVRTQACEVKQINSKQFMVILKQGYKRQIRKMTQALGNSVNDLYRVRIGDIALPDCQKITKNIIILDNLPEGFYTDKISFHAYK